MASARMGKDGYSLSSSALALYGDGAEIADKTELSTLPRGLAIGTTPRRRRVSYSESSASVDKLNELLDASDRSIPSMASSCAGGMSDIVYMACPIP